MPIKFAKRKCVRKIEKLFTKFQNITHLLGPTTLFGHFWGGGVCMSFIRNIRNWGPPWNLNIILRGLKGPLIGLLSSWDTLYRTADIFNLRLVRVISASRRHGGLIKGPPETSRTYNITIVLMGSRWAFNWPYYAETRSLWYPMKFFQSGQQARFAKSPWTCCMMFHYSKRNTIFWNMIFACLLKYDISYMI